MFSPPEPRSRRAFALRGTLRTVGSLVLLALLFAVVPLREVWDALSHADAVLLGAAWSLHAAHVLLTALQLHRFTLALRLRATLSRVLTINLSTALYGLLLPGYLAAGAVRWYKLSRAEGGGAAPLTAIVLNRLLETIVLVGLGVGFWITERRGAGDPVPLWIAEALLFTVAAYVVAVGGGASALLAGLGRSVPAARRVTDPLVGALRHAHGITPSAHLATVGVSVVRHALDLAGVVLLARAVGIEVSWITLGWVRSAIRLATMLPLSVSGVGVRDVGLVLMLHPFGVPAPSAVALGLLMLSRGLLEAGCGLVVELSPPRGVPPIES